MEKWYNLDTKNIMNKLNSNFNGLTEQEAKTRLEENGYNKLKDTKNKSMIYMFLQQFKDAMIIVLIIASILSGVVSYIEKEPLTDTFIILIVVLLNAILGFVQESKAEKAIEALKKLSAPYIKVKREGKIVNTKVEELVIGDIVLVEAGDYVPADMRILESHSLKIEEATLTGESVPAEKDNLTIFNETPLADRDNMMFSRK